MKLGFSHVLLPLDWLGPDSALFIFNGAASDASIDLDKVTGANSAMQ